MNNNQNNGYQNNNQYNNQYNKNFPYNHGTAKTIAIVIAAVVGFFLFWGFIGFMSDCSDRVNKDLARQDSIQRAKAEATPDPAPCKWEYDEQKDAMTDAVVKYAEAHSKIRKGGRFEGDRMDITIRKQKGTDDVMLTMAVRQFYGSKYYGENYVTLRVDSGKPSRYTFVKTSDGDTRTVFVSNAKKFIKELSNAKSCKIETPVFREGRIIFNFEFGDSTLVWK